jgi:predicted phage terminase large subunit-like protein
MDFSPEEIKTALAKLKCEQSHLYFTRFFFKSRQNIKFKVNWHHALIADKIEGVINGSIKNLVVTVPPGSSKTETAVINFIARGLALNPRCRFLHLSGSDALASLNSATARDIVRSDEYQKLWPLKIAEDADSKKRWNVEIDGQIAGGVYATALGGQIVGFRAGHMAPGFQGAIVIDDPLKPEDAFSKKKVDDANRKLLTTVKSRKANPETPMVIIMQRIAENDPVGFIQKGNLDLDFDFVVIPALITKEYVNALAPRYQALIEPSEADDKGRMSYWPYKEPLTQLLKMESGGGSDQTGAKISRHVFNSQYNQAPIALGGNIIKSHYFIRYKELPTIKYRHVFADTAQKTKEANDYSVFEEWGMGDDNKIYLLDMLRGKWEAPDLQKNAIAFWAKCKGRETQKYGSIRKLKVEDKSSGTGLVQTLKVYPYNIPVEAIERDKDKLTRVMDGLPYLECGQVCIPEDARFTSDFVAECESFSPDMSHEFDDQIDPMLDAIVDMLSTGNKMKTWEQFAKAKGI